MRYVLVHGSWHDGSLCGPVAARLRGDGHEEVTGTNPGGLAAKLVEAGRD